MSNKLKRLGLVCAVVTACVSVLPACTPLIVGGAVMGGMVASDRRTTGTVVEDEGIELRAAGRIREQLGERAHVNLLSYNRQVLITGEVPSAQDKQLVEQLVSGVENVRSVVNDLGVMGHSTFTQRSSDTLVTGRVKASLVDTKELSANAFRITTERGTTYLMGRVTQREAKIATDVVSSVSGVQRVVRVLEIITDEELARIQNTSASDRTSNK
jgi:osmotically-inducible protein OsmY